MPLQISRQFHVHGDARGGMIAQKAAQYHKRDSNAVMLLQGYEMVASMIRAWLSSHGYMFLIQHQESPSVFFRKFASCTFCYPPHSIWTSDEDIIKTMASVCIPYQLL
jgi:hypothetical protein